MKKKNKKKLETNNNSIDYLSKLYIIIRNTTYYLTLLLRMKRDYIVIKEETLGNGKIKRINLKTTDGYNSLKKTFLRNSSKKISHP